MSSSGDPSSQIESGGTVNETTNSGGSSTAATTAEATTTTTTTTATTSDIGGVSSGSTSAAVLNSVMQGMVGYQHVVDGLTRTVAANVQGLSGITGAMSATLSKMAQKCLRAECWIEPVEKDDLADGSATVVLCISVSNIGALPLRSVSAAISITRISDFVSDEENQSDEVCIVTASTDTGIDIREQQQQQYQRPLFDSISKSDDTDSTWIASAVRSLDVIPDEEHLERINLKINKLGQYEVTVVLAVPDPSAIPSQSDSRSICIESSCGIHLLHQAARLEFVPNSSIDSNSVKIEDEFECDLMPLRRLFKVPAACGIKQGDAFDVAFGSNQPTIRLVVTSISADFNSAAFHIYSTNNASSMAKDIAHFVLQELTWQCDE
ncbi:hypothetical protein GQ42DRAFT_12367 [Ramicandelaber brevisporus]|nr:hypothetical protein GQ42DRAFT_12367 [Ramicandelaber brevisporus]